MQNLPKCQTSIIQTSLSSLLIQKKLIFGAYIMERFQHKMRTTQHAKSVQIIMTRTNYQFFTSKSPRKRLSPQAENITTYLRKFQIEKQNINLAKRIMQCESQHSKDKYIKEWQNFKRFLKVRSNFKKTLHAKEPQIFKFQPILGKGHLKVDFAVNNVSINSLNHSNRKLYKFCLILGANEFQPDKNFITDDLIKKYSTTFYAPLFLKRKKISCKLFQIHENDYHEIGRFQIDMALSEVQEVDVLNRLAKSIGKISFSVRVEGGRKKMKRKNFQQKENLSSMFDQSTNGTTFRKTFLSRLPV